MEKGGGQHELHSMETHVGAITKEEIVWDTAATRWAGTEEMVAKKGRRPR